MPTPSFVLEAALTIYDLDWTAQSSQNIKTNTTYTVDGKTWTTENGANSNTFDITSGTGLVFTSISGNTANYGDNTRTATLFRVDLSSIISDLAFAQYYAIRLLTRISFTSLTSNFQFGKFGLEHAGSPATMHMVHGKGFSTSANALQSQISTTTTSQRSSAVVSTDDVLGLIYRPMFNVDFISGAFGTSFPKNYTLRSSWAGGMASGVTANVIRDASSNNLRLLYVFQETSGTGSFTATVTRMRVEGYKFLIPP
jgi:hypothetical protein